MKNYPNYALALTNKRNSLPKVKEQNVKFLVLFFYNNVGE